MPHRKRPTTSSGRFETMRERERERKKNLFSRCNYANRMQAQRISQGRDKPPLGVVRVHRLENKPIPVGISFVPLFAAKVASKQASNRFYSVFRQRAQAWTGRDRRGVLTRLGEGWSNPMKNVRAPRFASQGPVFTSRGIDIG